MEGRLDRADVERVFAELEGADQATRDRIDWLRVFLERSRTVALTDPPPELTATLVARFEGYATHRQSPGMFERVRAALTFDSRLHPLAAGVRQGGPLDLRRNLVFSTESVDVAIDVFPIGASALVELEGQILEGGEGAGDWATVQLMADGMEVAITGIDRHGEFFLTGIPLGDYELVVTAERAEIILAPVSL
ncbi:MAG: hypothetical protein H0V96_00570 [Acidimicrobiia bacterium]|nr:hypothetical protein [Acidimicrobiia bacterium]